MLLEQFMEHLFHASWQATIVAALILVIARCVPLAPRAQHAILAIGLLKFALPPMLAFPTGLFSFVTPLDRRPLHALEFSASGPALSIMAMVYLFGCVIAGMRTLTVSTRLSEVCSSATPVLDLRALQLLNDLRDAFQIRRTVVLVESDAVTVPFAAGWLRPRIVVPPGLLAMNDELRSVLAHELAHVRRHDIAFRWLGAALGVAWWFHPLLPLLRRRMRSVSEECCDDLAVSMRGVTVAGYRNALVMVAELASRRSCEWVAAMSGESGTLRHRIVRLTDPRARSVSRWQTVMVLIAAILLLPGIRVTTGRLIPRIELLHVEAGSVTDPHQARHAARHANSH